MPKNKIKVNLEAGSPLKCTIWDNDGVQRDASSIFIQVRGVTARDVVSPQTEFTFKHNQTDLIQIIKVAPAKKELEFEVPSETIRLILTLLEG